ncbi:MAG: YDG domain-containing protein [Clostridia bacterium]|nr:YDG domain-containing protein [Clostridia bacterium]MDY4082893.1 YDG domain-containing protein [Eubacteriales bacterium]
MNKSNRHNLIAILASLIAVVMIFGMAVVLGGDFGAYTSGNETESLDNIYDSSEDTTVESTGWVSNGSNASSGTQIGSSSALTTWLSSGSGTGYLTTDFEYDLGSYKNSYNIASSKTLNGNGHTITLKCNSFKSGSSTDQYMNEYGKIGMLVQKNEGTITNLKIIATGRFYAWYNSGATWMGIVCGENTGTISNVSVECRAAVVAAHDNKDWTMLGGIVGYNSGAVNNVYFNLNSSIFQTSNGNNSSSAYSLASGIAGQNTSTGVISGCTIKTTSGNIYAEGKYYGVKRSASVCANNDGKVYGIVTDGSVNLTSDGATHAYTNTFNSETVSCGIDANGSANSGRKLSTSSGFTWEWYFTGTGSNTVFHYKKAGVESGEYIYNKIVGSTTTNVASSKVKEATFGMSQGDATFNLQYYYDCIPYVIHYNNGTEVYNAKVSDGAKSWTYTYDGTAKTTKFVYYRVNDNGNTTTKVSESEASNSVEGTNKGTYSGKAAGITYNASGSRNYCAASNTTFTTTINARNATLKLPQFIYDKNGYNGGKYSIDGSTWTSVNATDTDILNAIVGKTTWVMAPVGASSIEEIAPSAVGVYESPSMSVTSGTAINSQTTLESFLDGSDTVGYLTGSFSISYGANGSTKTLASGKTLYGNGYTITANYSNAGTGWNNGTGQYTGGFLKSNAGTIRDLNYIFNGTSYVDNSTEMNSGPFIGQNTGTITNCLVDYRGNYQVHGTSTNTYVLGGVVAYNSGTMNNVTFKMNTTTAATNGNLGGAYVMRLNTRSSSKAYAGGVVGINASSGVINGAKYIQVSGQLRADLNNASSDTPTCSMAAAICALNQGNIYGMLIDGRPNVFNEKTSSNVSHFAVTKSSATTGNSFSSSGAMPVVINGTTSTERDDIYTINLGYSYSTMSASDVEVFFSGSGTSTAITIALSSTVRSAGNKVLTVGGNNYWSDSENRQLAKWTASDLVFNYSTGGTLGTITYSINRPAVEYAPAGQGFIESDLGGLISSLTSKLQLSDGSTDYAGKLIAGYTYKTSNLTGGQLNSNYDITVETLGKYYAVGNIDIRVNDLYHVYGREVYTWYAYNSSTHPSDYQYAIPTAHTIDLTIDESAWLLGGTYYKTKIASYNNQVNAYTPTLSLQGVASGDCSLLTFSTISDNTIKALIKYNVYNVVSNTAATNIYIGKEMNTGNVYDLSTSKLGTATFESFNASGYKFYFNPSTWQKSGVKYVGFAVAGNPANVDASFLDMSDANKYYVTLSRNQMETYFGTGNTFDLDLVYLYNATTASEADVKDFLAGTPGKYGGAQKLTLTGNVTITSALGSAVIFNQYKTLDGAGYTITINTPTGGNYASSDGTTYTTPGYPTNVIGYTNYVYRGGLAAVSCGTFQNVNIKLGGDLGTSTDNAKSYAIGGVVGLNQGGSFSNVKVTVNSNQTISLDNPAVWGTAIGISSGGSLHDITIGGDRNKTITNNSGNTTHRSYIGGVVGVMNLTDNDTNIGAFMGGGSLMLGYLDIAQPSAFYNIYNMYMGSYVGANAFKGLVTGVSYVSGKTPNIATLNNIVYFNKSESAVPFFSLTAGKHDASILSAYGALGQDDSTAISLTNNLKKGVGITLKYLNSYSTGADVVLDMLNLTIEGNTVKLNNDKIRLISCNGASFNYNERTVTFANLNDQVTEKTSNTTKQKTAVLDMSLAVTTADGLRLFLLGQDASNQNIVGEGKTTDPLMAIVNQIDLEDNIEITTWDNTTLLKVDANRTLNGNGNTVTMNITSSPRVYSPMGNPIAGKWEGSYVFDGNTATATGYMLIWDFMAINYGTIQNLKFDGVKGNLTSGYQYNLANDNIIGSLTAVNAGIINGVTYINNGIGKYENTYSNADKSKHNFNTIAGLVAGVNTGAITSTNVFNRAIFSVVGMFGGSVGVAMGAIAGVNDGGYAEGVKVFGDNAIELVSKTNGNTNTALYVGGVFGVANNYGSLTFAGNSISKATADKAVISNANVIVAGGMGIRYSGGTIMPYGSRGIFAGILTGELGYDTENRKMTGLAFMDMQTNPNLAVSFVYEAGVLSYFASDRIFNNSLTNGELTMMGYYGYDNGTMPDTSCVSGGKVDIVDYHGNSIFMYNYDATTNTNTYNGKTFLSGLQNYMNGSANTIEFDVKNVSSYLYVDDPMNMGIVCMSATLGGILTGTVLNYDTAKGLSGFATSTVNNVVSGVTYKYKWAIDPGRDSSNQGNIIQGFIEGKTATSFRAAGAALALTLTVDTEVSFDGMSAGRVLEAGRSINGDGHTLTVNVGNGTLDITDSNADNLYAIEGYDVVGVGGLFSAVQGAISNLNIVVNIKGGTINATGTNLAVGGAVGIISGVEPTFGFVQVNYNGTTINFNDGGKTLAFGGAVGAIYNNGKNTSLTLNQNDTNYVYMKGVTMTGTAQNVAVGGAVGLLQGSMLQGGANPTVLYLSSVNRAEGTQGFDVTSTVSFSGTGGLGGLVGIMAGSTLQKINIDQGMSFAGTNPSQYLWTAERDMVWTLNGGSGSAVSAMGGAVGVAFSGNINSVGVNSRARLINNVGTGAGDTTYNYIGGLLGLGSNSGDMSLTGTADAYTETINGKTYTLTTTKINYIYAGQIGMIAMPDGGYAGYVTGRYINTKERYFVDNNNYNLRNLVWIDFTRKQTDLYSKIQVFGATSSAGTTLSNVAGMSVLGYVSTDMYNTLTQAGYNKSGTYDDHDKLATYTKISAADFKGKDISIALVAYVVQSGTYYGRSLSIKLIGTLTTGGGGYTPYNTTANVDGTEYLRYWTAQIMAADNKTGLRDAVTINSNVLSANIPVSDMYFYTVNDTQGKHGYYRIQLFRNEVTITTEAQLKAFISNNNQGDSSLDSYVNAVAGTLAANITLNQNINHYLLAKDLYGSGSYTITLVPSDNMNADSMPIVSLCNPNIDADKYKKYAVLANNETPIMNTETRVFGLFVGGLKTGNVIEGVNFALNKQAWVTINRSNGKKPYEPYSMVAGIIMGINMGTIQNCTLELGASANFVVNRTITETGDNVFMGYAKRNMCIVGGFAGMNIGKYGSTATVGNCTLNMNDSAVIRSICEFRRNAGAGKYPHAQAMAGGMVGWVGARSDIINSTLNGGGLIEATSSGILYFYSTNWGYADVGWLRTQTLASGAGALIGVNTNNYILSAPNEEDHQDFRDIYDSNGNLREGWNTQPYTNVRPENHDQSTIHIDGVIINWFGYTIEDIKAMVQMDTDGYRIRGMQMVDSQDRPYYRGDGKPLTGVEFGYRQIAGICDWETIHNVYLVTPSDQGTTTERAGWPNRETDSKTADEGQYVDKDCLNSYRGTALPAGTYTSQYVGRGGVLGATKSSPFELYVYDNTNPNNLILKDKTALGTNIGLSWAGTGIDANLSFDFTIADPPAEGKFLWDTQVWQVQPTSSELFNAKPADAVVATEGDGWTSPSQPNLLFYNDVYDKINSMSDAIHYADVSHTFARGKNVYLYYSYGTTGSASIDRTHYYYDANTGVYYDKYTTSFGNNFNMPALKFYGSNGAEIPNSSISSTLYRSLEVYNFTGIDPTHPDKEEKITSLTYYDKDKNVVASDSDNIASVGLNKPVAGSYRISFNTRSQDVSTGGSAIKDVPSKTIIFPDTDIVLGNFKVVEIITPFGLYAQEMNLITEYSNKGNASKSQIDVQPKTGREDYISANKTEIQNINWTNAGLTYVRKSTDIGVYDIKITLKDWEYYGYLPSANGGQGGLGYNRTYLINGSGFSLEYDFKNPANNTGITINGSTATLTGRGLVIPTDVKINYVQKEYDGDVSASATGNTGFAKSITPSNAAITFSSFYNANSTTKNANAGNGKGVSITGVSRITYDGNWFDVDRYYSTSTITTGYGFRATTTDNWTNSSTPSNNKATNHKFSNSINVGSTGELIVDEIGTILPKCDSVNYIAKIYDGDNSIDYATAKTSYGSNLPSDLKPKATFGTANVVYGGQGKYNSIVFEVVAIQDMTKTTATYYYAFKDKGSYGNNYGISGTFTSTATSYTLADKGVIVPDMVSVDKVKKVYDNTRSFKPIGTTLNDNNMLFTISNTKVGNKSITANQLGFTTSAGRFDTESVGTGIRITFTNATQFVYPTGLTAYPDRYFMTTTVGNYALDNNQYNAGVIVPKELTWKSNIKNLVYKIYDGGTTYDNYASASTLFDGLVSGDTTTKPTITFAGSDVNTAGVGISIATTRNAIDGTYYDQVNGYTNYYMPTSSATGMILPATVTFSGITKVYDGNTDLTDMVYTNMTTTVTNSQSLTGVKLNPVGAFDGRHAYQTRQVVWTTTSFKYDGTNTTYYILQEAKSATSGKNYAGNYCVAGNSNADITPCTLTQADFLGVTAKQNKSDGTTNATGLTFVYFAGAVYLVSGNVKKKNNDDNVDGAYALYKSSSLATTNTDGTYDVGTYDINVTALTGADAGNYTLAVPFDLGQDLVINQQEVNSVAITVMPTNKDYGADLPTATANGWSAKDSVTGGEISGLALSISAYQWVDDSNTAVTKTNPIGGYNLKVTGITMSGNDNYKLATGATYGVTVTPSGAKALYILPLENTISKVEKVYDGNTNLGTVTATKTISDYVGNYVSKNVQGYNSIARGNVKIKVITFAYYDNTGAQQTKYVIATGNADTMSNYYLDITPTDGYAVLQVGVITPKEVTIGTVSITQSDSRGVVANDTKSAPGPFEYYSTATYSYSATISGVIGGDTVSVSITDPCGGVYNADTYDLTFNSLTGADAGNYEFKGTLGAQLIIKPQTLASVSVSVKPINVVYGNAIPTTIDGATAAATDRKSGAGVTGNFTISGFSTTATSTSPIGGYDITIDYSKVGLEGTTNYVIGSTTTINVTVTPAEAKALYIIPADATINSVTKTYDGTTAFTGATIVTNPASITVTGTFADKNAGTGKSINVDVATFSYYNTQGTAVSVDIFKDTNYKVANPHTTNASVATIDGVGVINKYAIKGSEITGVTVTQTWKGNPSETAPFEYYYTATYVATGTFDRFNAYGDTVTVTLGIYKSTDGGHTNVSGTTDVGVGIYKISLLSVSATPNENFIVETGAEQYSNTTTFKIDPQVVTNVYVVGNHYATTYTGAPLTYDKNAANFKIYAIDLDDREVNISGGIKENGLTMGKDGQTFATSQTQVGIYNVKVSVNGSAEGNNYSFSAIDDADVYIDANMTEKTQFAIIPMAATLKTAYKTYDGNNTLAGATVKLVDAKSTAIDFGDAVVSATFDSANAGNRKLVFTTKEFAYYPTGTTSKTTLNIIQTSTTTPAEGEGEASVSTTFTNYHIGNSNTIDGVAYIIPRLVDLSSPSKAYDGTTSLGGEVSATGTVGGEKISISGNFVDCNAGENIGVTINVTDMELGGVHYNALSGNTNYCIAANNYTGTITQREIESSHLSLLQLARLNAKDGDKQVDMLDIAGSESANLTNSVEYTSMYKYQGIGGHLYVAVDKEAETDGNWSFKLYQDYATEIAKGLTFTVTMLDKNGTEVDFAQNSGTYTIKVVFGGGNYKQSTINTTFTITQQEVTDASKIFVYMDSFEGVYGVGNFKSPNASGYDYRIGIVDKVSGDIVEFVKGGGDNSFAIASLAFSRTQGGTANTNIEADAEGIYIGGYYLFAAAVTGSSDNFDTSTLDLSTANKKIYGIGKEAIDGNQSLYYILPALLDLTAVTKTYDGTVAFTDGSVDANNVTTFTYGSGVIAADKTMRLKGEFVDYNATHNNAGTSGTKGAVNINTEVMSVSKTLAGTTTTTDYNIALSTKDGNVVKTNYYVAIGSAETMIEVSDVAIIKKYKIENGAIQLSVQGYEGYEANSENKVTKYINAPADTIEFTYANGYRYNDKFVIMGLQPIAGQGLFNATDDINAMSVVLGPDNISNASNTPYDLVVKSFTASNYEWGSNATIGKLKINKQLVNEDSIAISIPPLTLEYNGNVQKPEGVDKFSFTVKDFYTGLSAKADGAGGSGVSGIKYYKDSVEVPNPTDIGGYSVSVVVDTSYIDTNNYKMADGVSSITKQADNGNAVFFILPKALTVTNVTKQYDGNANFVDMQVNGVTTSDNPKTIITIDDGGFVAADNTVDTKNAVYSAIIAAGGYFDSKDIAETVSVVYFRSLSFSYRNTVDGVVTGGTAYYINGTNYMVPSASVGYITPAHLTITGMTKTYDGTTTLQFEYSYDSGVGVNKTTESVEDAMNNGEAIRPAGEYTSADVTAVGTKIAVKFNVTEMVIGGVTYYRLVNNAKDGGTSNASNYYIYTSNDSFDYANGMITIDGIGTIKAIAISDGTTGTTADASISNITIDGKAYDSTSAFIYNYSKSYGVANLKATFKFFGGELTCQGEFDSTKNMMKVVGVNGDVLYFTITFTNQTSAKDAGEYVVKIELKEIESANNNAYEFGTAGALTLSKKFKINKYQLKQDELKIFVAALEREYNGREGIVTDGSNATTWVADKVNSTLTYTITLSGATTSSTLTIYSVKKTNEAQEFINKGAYALQAQVRGYSDTNYMLGDDVYYNLYRRADQSADVFEITPMLINLEAETEVVKNFDGTASYLYAAGVAGEQVLIGNNAIDGRYARAGVHTLENTTLEILDVVLDPTVDGFNSTLYNEETKVLDRDTAKANYKIVGTTTYKLTINPSNIVVAERRYDGTSAEIEVAITSLAGTQFLNDTVDKTNLAGVLKISVNSFASFELATTDEIVESSIKKTESLDALGYSSYTITFNYKAKGTLDAATYTDRYVFAVAGATDGYSTNLALTSSELADGQMGGTAITTGTAVADAGALATALKANADIHLTANIYGWDASLLDSAITYTGTLQGNGYSIQLVGGLNSDTANGGAFIASLGGTIRDVNFKFTSDKTLKGAANVGLVVGNMAGNMTNVSLDIINAPTIDGATTIGGLAGTASGRMTNATVIFNASVDNTAFGGLASSATGVTFTNVSVRGYNGKTTTGKTLVATSSGCAFNGVIDMIGGTLGASNITNLYTVNALATGAKANGKLELLTPHTEGFIEYYFTTLNKTGVKTHNVYGGGASERDKTMYQTYGTIATNDTVALAIETLAPRNRFIWEAYSHSYQTEVAGGGHVNLSLNRYVAFMPIGTVIAEDGYTLDGQSKTDMSFITVDVTMFRPAIGIRGSQEIAASGSIIKEVEYTGGQISHEVSITVDGKVTSVSVSGVDAGYYDNIVVELTGDVTTDDINYDTTNRTAVVAKIDDGATVAGAILIIYPKQSALPTDFSKYYDTTSIGEFTTTIDGKSVTLLGTYVDNNNAPASDVGTTKVSFANTLNPIRNVLVDKDGNYIAQHHKTESDGTTTFSYTKISVTTTGGIESYFTTSTDFSTISKNSLMRAIAQLIDYDKATTNDATLVGNANYTNAWVYNVTAIKAADSTDGYFDGTKGYFFVPKTINNNAGNFTFTADGLAVGSLNNIYIGATKPSAFAVLAGTTSSNASILPAQLGATYTGDLEQCFRSSSLSTNIALTKGEWAAFTLPTTMTEAQKTAFNTFKTNASVAIAGTAILEATSGISKNGNVYTADHDNNTVYLQLDLPSQFGGIDDAVNNVKGGNYVIKPTAQVLKLRYFFKEGDKYILETYKDVLMIGKAVGNSDYHTLGYKMKNNINMKSSLITPFDWDNGIAFAGSIDGQGFALTNYILKGENNVGLFANMGATANVTNLVMGNVMVVATATTGEVIVSAVTTSTVGSVTNVATEMRVVTATTGSVSVANADESFVRVHKQSGSNVTVSTLLNGTTKDTYLTPSDIYALTKFGATNAERVSNFLGKYVLNNTNLTYTATDAKIIVGVNNFREYWGWYNICPWLEGLNAEGKTWNGIRPTKTNTTQTVTQ